MEFFKVARDLNYEGAIPALWNQLDDDNSGMITLMELAPAYIEQLDDFRSFLLEHFETAEAVWHALARPGEKLLSAGEFTDGCCAIGWDENPRQIHSLLVGDPYSMKNINIDDLKWLLP